MSVSADVIGRNLPSVEATVERGRLRFFAQAIGEENHIYSDVEAARAAGHPDLPAPPTFLFGLKLGGPDPHRWIADIGIDMRFVLHGTQRFEYRQLVFAGDAVVFRPRISDVYEKRGGALEFVVVDTEVTRGADVVAVLTETLVVRHPKKETAA